jgi:hypothetical protein
VAGRWGLFVADFFCADHWGFQAPTAPPYLTASLTIVTIVMSAERNFRFVIFQLSFVICHCLNRGVWAMINDKCNMTKEK